MAVCCRGFALMIMSAILFVGFSNTASGQG